MRGRGLGVLDDDGLDDVGDVFERVQRGLHRLDDVLVTHHVERVELAAEQPTLGAR